MPRARYTTTSLRTYPQVRYETNNYCRTCEILTEKDVLICPECHARVRTHAKTKSGLKLERGLIE